MHNRDAEIAARYRAGESAVAIAKDLGTTKKTVYVSLKRSGAALKQPNRSLTEEEIAAVLRRYGAGESALQISKDYPVDVSTIRNVLHRHEVETRPELLRKALTPDDRALIIEACRQGRTIGEVAALFHISEATITRILAEYRDGGGVLVLPKGRPAGR